MYRVSKKNSIDVIGSIMSKVLKWPKIIKLKKIHPPKYPINYVNRASEWYIVHTISYIRNACLKILSKISVFYILFFYIL